MTGSHAIEPSTVLKRPTLVGSGSKVPPGTSNQPTALPTIWTGKRQFPSTLGAGDAVGEATLGAEATLDVDGEAAGVMGPAAAGADGPHEVSRSSAARTSLTLTNSTQGYAVRYVNSEPLVGRSFP